MGEKSSTKFITYVGPIEVDWNKGKPATFRKLYLDTLQALLATDTADEWAIVEELDKLILEGDEPAELDVLEIGTAARDALSNVLALRRQGLQGVCPPIDPVRYNDIKPYWGMIATATPKRPRAPKVVPTPEPETDPEEDKKGKPE